MSSETGRGSIRDDANVGPRLFLLVRDGASALWIEQEAIPRNHYLRIAAELSGPERCLCLRNGSSNRDGTKYLPVLSGQLLPILGRVERKPDYPINGLLKISNRDRVDLSNGSVLNELIDVVIGEAQGLADHSREFADRCRSLMEGGE